MLAGILGLGMLLLVTAAVYGPGLTGGFILDDGANLGSLARIEGPLDWRQLASFVFSSAINVGDRYVSLLSFGLQHASWPGDPWSFKLVNLILHLLNGCLLFGLFVRAGALMGMAPRHRLVAGLFAASLWLLHPLAVSTVLYVVQRMTQLATLFTLLGLLAYLHGRIQLVKRPLAGYGWMSAGVAAGGLFAALSKETGILLPVYILVLEVTLLQRVARGRGWRLWAAVFLVAPLVLTAAYLATTLWPSLANGYRLRGFGAGERLLTEARVLMDYLQMILFPRPSLLGVFHDDYSISRGILDPPQTLAAAMLIASLLASGIWLRKRAPMYGFAVLWFFGGHLLESTVIPLELYFEHRNYLPMAGVLWAVAHYLWKGWSGCDEALIRRLLLGLGFSWLAVLAALTFFESRIWGNPLAQAVTWAREHPASPRAQLYGAAGWLALNDAGRAQEGYARAARVLREAGGYSYWLVASCVNPRVSFPDFREAAEALRTYHFSHSAVGGLAEVVRLKEEGRCESLPNSRVMEMFRALLANPNYELRRRNTYVALGRLQASAGAWDEAVASLDQAFRVAPAVDIALLQVKFLASAGRREEAWRYIESARSANRGGWLSRTVFEKEIADWEQALKRAQ